MPRLSQGHIKPVLCIVRNGKRGRQYDCRKQYACGNGAFLQVKKEKNKGLGLFVAKGTLRKGQKVGDFKVVDVRDEPDEDKYCFKYNGKYHVTDMDCLMNRINYGHPKNCRFGQVNHGRVPVFATKTIRAGTFLNTLYGDKGHLLQMKIETKTAATYSPAKHKQERNGTRNSRDEDQLNAYLSLMKRYGGSIRNLSTTLWNGRTLTLKHGSLYGILGPLEKFFKDESNLADFPDQFISIQRLKTLAKSKETLGLFQDYAVNNQKIFIDNQGTLLRLRNDLDNMDRRFNGTTTKQPYFSVLQIGVSIALYLAELQTFDGKKLKKEVHEMLRFDDRFDDLSKHFVDGQEYYKRLQNRKKRKRRKKKKRTNEGKGTASSPFIVEV